jgi:hypothetical protein
VAIVSLEKVEVRPTNPCPKEITMNTSNIARADFAYVSGPAFDFGCLATPGSEPSALTLSLQGGAGLIALRRRAWRRVAS